MSNENTTPETDGIDYSHPVFDRFRAAGFDPEALTDPAEVDPAAIEAGGWQAVVADSHGLSFYDVPADAAVEMDRAPTGVAVEIEAMGATQPIDFAEDGPLYDEIKPMKHLEAAASWNVTLFRGPDVEREEPTFDSAAAAVEALADYHSEGFIEAGIAEAIAAATGATLGDSAMRDDPHVEGGRMIRAPHVASAVASAVLGEASGADSGISGHKQRHRQRFYRNLDALCDHLGIDAEGSQ